MNRLFIRLLLMTILMMCIPINHVAAQSIESLVMPGKVIQGHAEAEEDCAGCHKRFDRKSQRLLCLNCHEDIAADLDGKTGFHGRSSEASSAQCASCHADHKGRDADIVELDEADFDHQLTDFHLLGKHRRVECRGCHAPENLYRDAPGNCNGCHVDDDTHKGNLGESCSDCHNASAWKDTTFDHETTEFPLLGKHRTVECNSCHEDQTFTDTPATCYACHAADDVHKGRSGQQCDDCHNSSTWTDTSFDHARDTTFPLLGGHDNLSCNDCHNDDPFAESLQTSCVSCHLDDDKHNGRNGIECAECHSINDWTQILFDHARDTNFLLNGAHKQVACNDCHINPVFESSPGTTCHSCHVDDDPHKGTQGEDCQGCHTENKWSEVPFFDHGLTSFPLLGEHDNLECDSCHQTQVFTDTDSECLSCHMSDDPHGAVFADSCETCHNPVAWDLWMFDHNTQTDFLLQGAHTEVACDDCHRTSVTSMQKIGERCGACHRADDKHDGEFGLDCGRCHNDQSFKDVKSLP